MNNEILVDANNDWITSFYHLYHQQHKQSKNKNVDKVITIAVNGIKKEFKENTTYYDD